MATRARELLDRSRGLLDRSRAAAAQFLAGTQQPAPTQLPPASPDRSGEPAQPPAASEEALVGICASIALRDLNLVDSLLAQLEQMEAEEEDQDRLAELYRLDHLAARLRRNAENLRVLAGRDAADAAADTASLVDVVRAAMSSIEGYTRVSIGRMVSLGVVGFAAEDLSRLLAEILDNATTQSPPNALVKVSAHLTEQGSVLVRVEDEGIGLPPERLTELNERLEGDSVLDDDAVRHMGLAVVRRLATRHDLRVRLDRRLPHGTTATILLPAGLVCELPEASWSGGQTVVLPQASFTGGRVQDPGGHRRPTQHRYTASGLPRRGAGTEAEGDDLAGTPRPSPAPRPRPLPEPATAGTTAGGLPRRVPRSIKNTSDLPASPEPAPPPAAAEELSEQDGHQRLLADLDAFSDGERAALAEHEDNPPASPPNPDGTAEESQQ